MESVTGGQKSLDDFELVSGEVEQESLVVFKDKKDFIDNKTKVVLNGVWKSQFNRWVINGKIDGQEVNFNISKSNFNDLIKFFGKNTDSWRGKSVYVTGRGFKGEVKEGDLTRKVDGATLILSLE